MPMLTQNTRRMYILPCAPYNVDTREGEYIICLNIFKTYNSYLNILIFFTIVAVVHKMQFIFIYNLKTTVTL